MSDVRALEPSMARAMVRSLTRGTTVANGARHIHVGHAEWVAAQRELLGEIAEDGYADTKFVRGTYGAGKSHFLALIQDVARETGWLTAHVECRIDGVQIDRFETLYPRIATKLRCQSPDSGRPSDHGQVDAVRDLMDEWMSQVLQLAGVKVGAVSRPFDVEERVHRILQRTLGRSNLPASFVKGLTAYARASLSSDDGTTNAIIDWIKGGNEKIRLPGRYLHGPEPLAMRDALRALELRPIGAGTAQDALRGLLWLIRNAGHQGLVLCIDEVEELARLKPQKRQDQALQALREHVDNAGGESGFQHFCLYLAATPEMFENAEYFPRYDALATRIQPVGDSINWRAPVIDLDRTLLTQSELQEVAARIWSVHQVAYGPEATKAVSPELAKVFVAEVTATRMRIAKPRLLVRMLIDELEQARQRGADYVASAPSERLVAAAKRTINEARI